MDVLHLALKQNKDKKHIFELAFEVLLLLSSTLAGWRWRFFTTVVVDAVVVGAVVVVVVVKAVALKDEEVVDSSIGPDWGCTASISDLVGLRTDGPKIGMYF